jgi:hypothetical protein
MICKLGLFKVDKDQRILKTVTNEEETVERLYVLTPSFHMHAGEFWRINCGAVAGVFDDGA